MEDELRREMKKYTHGKQMPLSMIRYTEHAEGRHLTDGQKLSKKHFDNRELSRAKGKTLHSISLQSTSAKQTNEDPDMENTDRKPETVPLHALKSLFALEGIVVDNNIIDKAMAAFKKVVPTGTQMDMNSLDKAASPLSCIASSA